MTNTAVQKYVLIKDRVEYYLDFALNLLRYIHKYYLDKNSLFSDLDIEHHFSFCYNKVCEEFKQEGIDFSKDADLKKYLYNYYHDHFYKSDKFETKEEIVLSGFVTMWKNIFNVDNVKNKSDINLLIEVYLMFDETIEPKLK